VERGFRRVVPAQQVPRLHTHEHTVIVLLLSHLIKPEEK
jgi:hypothetical protein